MLKVVRSYYGMDGLEDLKKCLQEGWIVLFATPLKESMIEYILEKK